MRRFMLILTTWFGGLFVASSTMAISISILPGSQNIDVAGNASVDLVISGLGNFTSPSLGAFDIDLTYNSAILSAHSLTLGNFLGASLQFFDISTPGMIHLEELSFVIPGDLNAAQPGTFTLATLIFRGLAPGASTIDFTSATLSDELGNPLENFTLQGGSIAVRGASVPDAGSTGALLVLALAVLPLLRRLFQNSWRDWRVENALEK
jgi:hypothetical protein